MAEIPVTIIPAFIEAATWHGDLKKADQMLEEYPELCSLTIHTAAICGNHFQIKKFIAEDATSVHETAAPFGGTALAYLGLSKYLRLKKEREEDFFKAATLLLDAGADPNAGFWTAPPHPEFETVLYGVAGVAHNEALTSLLLSRGADPTDVEVLYHSPESYDLGVLRAVVETGRLSQQDLVLMLIRKHDWHDYYGVKYLLEKGTNVNESWGKDNYPLTHAISRDNHIEIIRLLFDYKADPYVQHEGRSAVALAAHRGRGDILKLIMDRGYKTELEGVDRLIAACALAESAEVKTIVKEQPKLKESLRTAGGSLIAPFSGNGNADGVQQLINCGVSATEQYAEGDGYWGIPAGSLPIHVASWRLKPKVVELLISNGSPVDIRDPNGLTPLQLFVKASTDSYWSDLRTTETAKLLLDAGADISDIVVPTGYEELDSLISSYGK